MTSMTAEDRQKWLKRLLPALAILVLYFTFVAPRVGPTGRVGSQAAGVAPEVALMQLEQEKQALYREIAGLQAQTPSAGAAAASGDPDLFAQPGYANHAIQRLSAVLVRHRARILSESGQEVKAARETLPASVREIGEAMQGQGIAPGTSLWSIRFNAAYPDAARAIDSLTRESPPIVPVSLEMIPPEGEADPDWIVTIWVNR